ncbi:MAG: putative colanic acid biosynthesis acetyltransferase [Muribaculum sp.]|nr:putative colanic acid biosynthesis acetyltransferase [Muribaculum sp.]
MNSKYINHLGHKHQLIRLLWSICWGLLARWLPRGMASGWKRFLLRSFGARIAKTAVVYSSAKVYYPANLIMEDYSCIANDVDCYNVDIVHIGKFATVSQGCMLCTASHDIKSPNHELITAPINIANQAWVGAQAFIGMGVTIGEGAVVGARAAVFNNVEPWNVVGGNPAKFIKKRIIINNKSDV